MSSNEQYRILIVDDEVDMNEYLSGHLFIEGYSVSTALDGAEAISMAKETDFDVVLLDLHIPNVDGFDVLKFIKSKSPKTKVIIVTGFASLENVAKCRRLNADEIIEKPFDLRDIIAAVENAIGA
jgi:DNA-binding response OmpR family regulator